MKNKAADFFSPKDKEQIKAAIKKVEATTSGEIAVMVIDESDSYREGATLGAAVLSMVLALVLEVIIGMVLYSKQIWSHTSILPFSDIASGAKGLLTVWYYIPFVILLYFPCRWLLAKCSVFRACFISRRRMDEAVRERAVSAFYEKGLFRTRDETGILIFISLLERTVWIMGDRGINSKIPAGFWDGCARDLTKGIREKAHSAAVLDTIRRCGEELAKFFPRKPDDKNELPDEVLV